MSGKASKVLMIAIAVSALALPLTSIHANAMDVHIDKVSSDASNGSGGALGSLIDRVLKANKDRKDKEQRDAPPLR